MWLQLKNSAATYIAAKWRTNFTGTAGNGSPVEVALRINDQASQRNCAIGVTPKPVERMFIAIGS